MGSLSVTLPALIYTGVVSFVEANLTTYKFALLAICCQSAGVQCKYYHITQDSRIYKHDYTVCSLFEIEMTVII